MLAIISDIHGNTEALNAVLTDIAARKIKKIICLGDIIGYGAEPRQCVDIIRSKVTVCLMGNHDFAVLYEPSKFNVGAESACFWTRRQLEEEPDEALRSARFEFIGSLPVTYKMSGEELGLGEMVFLHGSPRRPINEYIFPDDIYNTPSKVQGYFERFGHVCFVGHTHLPGVFVETQDFYSPDELGWTFEINPSRKALINVGSIGQPRDHDNRACYVVLDRNKINFVRVPYDVDKVMKQILSIPDLDSYLGTRLKEGR